MSASKMRAAAAADDYDSFKNGLPSKFERTDGKKLGKVEDKLERKEKKFIYSKS